MSGCDHDMHKRLIGPCPDAHEPPTEDEKRRATEFLTGLAAAPAPTEAGASVVKWPAAWDHCYEDMGDDPCGRPPVGARPDPEGGDLYPVCRKHLRP